MAARVAGELGYRVRRAVVAMGGMNSDGWKLKLGGGWTAGLAASGPTVEGVCAVQE